MKDKTMKGNIIDIHTHIASYKVYPKEFLDNIENSLKESFAAQGQNEVPEMLIHNLCLSALNDEDCSKLLSQMDECGIHKSVLLITDFGYKFKGEQLPLEEIYKIYKKVLEKHKDRFIVFAGVDPRRGKDGQALLEKGIKEFEFKGLKLYPPCGFELNDACLDDYYKICNRYKIPVIIHTGPSIKGSSGEEKYPESILEVAKKYKDINFILAHAAIKNYEIGLRAAKETENIYLDISSFETELDVSDFWKEKINILMEEIPDKILFGTDWPMFCLKGKQKKWIDEIKKLDFLSEEKLEALFYKNALKVLNMEGCD